MNNKIIKIIGTIILVACIIIGIMYLVDLNRMNNNEKVLFSTWGRLYTTPLEENNADNKAQTDAKIINNYEFNYLLDVKSNNNNKKQKITVDDLSKKYDYDIYYYGLDSAIIQINNEKLDLKQALIENKVTMEQIIEKAEKDSKNDVIESDMYKDGGTMIYFYGTYTIIKSHSLDGNKDVYIGIPEMGLNNVR